MIAAVKPKAPAKHLRDDTYIDDDDLDLVIELVSNAMNLNASLMFKHLLFECFLKPFSSIFERPEVSTPTINKPVEEEALLFPK